MLVTVIAAFCTAYYFVNVAQFHMNIKRALKYPPGKRLKPLDCVQCLTVWLAVIFYFTPQLTNIFFTAFLAGFIATKIK